LTQSRAGHKLRLDMKALILLVSAVLLVSCAAIVRNELDERYGPADPARYQKPAVTDPASVESWRKAKQVLDRRCVLCHACSDAPCQLSLASFEGIARGTNKTPVYDGGRLRAADPTRLFFDAHGPAEWRKRGFSPVLNERASTPGADLDASVLFRALRLKQDAPAGPLPTKTAADAPQSCPAIEEFDRFAAASPPGMPYGLPALRTEEQSAIAGWLEAGAPHADPPGPSPAALKQAARWEAFLNADGNKARLMSRYLFEHLFFAHLYFGETGAQSFFRMVRSRTPPGQAVDLVATRRPYDDPGVARVYYRLQPLEETFVIKTHIPYPLDDERMDKFRRWFIDNLVPVTTLPSYDPEIASNPFATFREIPIRSRYRFMLEEAHFTISGFIKGTVCRGQIALSVINDRFWVFFLNPDLPTLDRDAEFLAGQADYLRLPSESGSNAFPLDWLGYGRKETKFLQAKAEYYAKVLNVLDTSPTLDLLWDGDGVNPSAGLTVFRHFDQGSVVQGLVGTTPKTAWIIGYPLLERIHYLLVAGFDIYGNVGHQLNTRIYMDYLRMEGEANFIALLPKASRASVRDYWYRGAEARAKEYIDGVATQFPLETGIAFKTASPARELMLMARERLQPALSHKAPLVRDKAGPAVRAAIARLGNLEGRRVSYMPQLVWLIVDENGRERHFTVLHNNAHSNISQLLDEDKRRLPDEDTLTVLEGLVGAYPNAFYRVAAGELPAFVDGVEQLGSPADYARLASRFGVAASNADFWEVSDRVIDAFAAQSPVDAALPDYGRFELR
jgi:Fatty acid cis/trans isomerase (CTI)